MGTPGVGKRAAFRGLAEFLVIVIGVLAAFAVDDWATDRSDRRAEARYLTGLLADLRVDSATLTDLHIPSLARAQATLEAVAPIARGQTPVPHDTIALLRQLAGSHFVPVRMGTRTTFQELLATGSLGLIRSPELRSAVVNYYELKDLAEARGDSRASGYGELIRSYLPEDVGRYRSAVDGAVAAELLRAFDIQQAVALLHIAEFERATNRHLNYLQLMRPTLDELRQGSQRLIAQIDREFSPQ